MLVMMVMMVVKVVMTVTIMVWQRCKLTSSLAEEKRRGGEKLIRSQGRTHAYRTTHTQRAKATVGNTELEMFWPWTKTNRQRDGGGKRSQLAGKVQQTYKGRFGWLRHATSKIYKENLKWDSYCAKVSTHARKQRRQRTKVWALKTMRASCDCFRSKMETVHRFTVRCVLFYGKDPTTCTIHIRCAGKFI